MFGRGLRPRPNDISMPRKCRVLPSFEPAFAGGSRPRNAALAQAYRVISLELETLKVSVGSKREAQHHAHRRDTNFYTIITGAMVGKD